MKPRANLPINGSPFRAVVAIVIVLSVLPYFSFYLHAMATTSLSGDEITSIRFFSRKGLLHSLTHYDLPNNHILFNVLTGLTLTDDYRSPLRARIWSFAFVLLAILLVISWFVRRRKYLAAALFAHAIGMNDELLGLSLQARGYGLLVLATVAVSIALLEWERESRGLRMAVFLSIVLGSWTVPTFIVFGCLLLILVCTLWPNKRNLILGLVTAASAVLIWVPHAPSMLRFAEQFGSSYRSVYTTPGAAILTFRKYLLGNPVVGFDASWWVVVVCAGGVIGIAIRDLTRGEGRGALVLVGAVLGYLLACLAIGTVPYRATAFVVVPVLLVAVRWLDRYMVGIKSRNVGLALAAGLALLIVVHNVVAAKEFRFVPEQNLEGIRRVLTDYFPERTRVCVGDGTQLRRLDDYLGADYQVGILLEDELFAAGREVCVATRESPAVRRLMSRFVDAYVSFAVQQRDGPVRVICAVPLKSAVSAVWGASGRLRPECIDGSLLTGSSVSSGAAGNGNKHAIRIGFDGKARMRALFIASPQAKDLEGAVAIVRDIDTGDQVTLGEAKVMEGFVVIPLGDRLVKEVDVLWGVQADSAGTFIADVWAWPSAWRSLAGDGKRVQGSRGENNR